MCSRSLSIPPRCSSGSPSCWGRPGMKRDFLAIESLTTEELHALLDRAAKMKTDRRPSDVLTVQERFGKLEGVSLTYVGDGNNVAHSLLTGCAMVGMNITVATPAGYEPISQIVKRAEELAAGTGARVEVTTDAAAAAEGADVLYTDVWASMGQEREVEERRLIFAPYQVNTALVARSASNAIVMHCLPAHRGEEITDEVIEGPQSVVWDQAENRLHAQKALLEWLLR